MHNIKLIHISTDYVFDGSKNNEYGKFDMRNPKNYYGETKVMVDDIVNRYRNSLIVRIPIIYGFNNENDKETFPTKVIRLLSADNDVYADDTQIRYPVLIDNVALSIKDALYKIGITHITSNRGVTRYQWAKIIARTFSLNDKRIRPSASMAQDRPLHTHLQALEDDYTDRAS